MVGQVMMDLFSMDMNTTVYFTQRMNLPEEKVMWTELKLSGVLQREEWQNWMEYEQINFTYTWKNVNSDIITETKKKKP